VEVIQIQTTMVQVEIRTAIILLSILFSPTYKWKSATTSI